MIAELTALGTLPTVAMAAVLACRLLTYRLPVLHGIARLPLPAAHRPV
jgi:hypothetical protein